MSVAVRTSSSAIRFESRCLSARHARRGSGNVTTGAPEPQFDPLASAEALGVPFLWLAQQFAPKSWLSGRAGWIPIFMNGAFWGAMLLLVSTAVWRTVRRLLAPAA